MNISDKEKREGRQEGRIMNISDKEKEKVDRRDA